MKQLMKTFVTTGLFLEAEDRKIKNKKVTSERYRTYITD